MKKQFLRFLLAFLILLPAFPASRAEAHTASYMSNKTEIPVNLEVSGAEALCQTQDGYVWIGQYSGLTRYDSFVLANKANGILVYGKDASAMVAVGTISVSSSKLTLTGATSGASFKYTTDGTNPKTSATAQTLTSGTTAAPASGTKIKVYGEKTGLLNSGIVEYTVA